MANAKNFGFFLAFWTISNIQIVSGWLSQLELSQFQTKLSVFDVEIKMLKYDVSEITNNIKVSNKTCYCSKEIPNLPRSMGEDGDRTEQPVSKHLAVMDSHTMQYENHTAILKEFKSKVVTEMHELGKQMKKSLHDEKKHTRRSINEMQTQIDEFVSHQKQFLSDVDKKADVLQEIQGQTETALSDSQNQTNLKIDRLEQGFKIKTKALNDLTTDFQQKTSESERHIKSLQSKIDDLEAKLNSVEQTNSDMKHIIYNYICGEQDKGWVTSSSFKSRFLVVREPRSWVDAIAYCKKLCSHLTELDSEDKSTYVQMLLTDTTFWAGGSDAAKEEEWRWVDSGTLMKTGFTNWRQNEPNNKDDEDCLEVSTRLYYPGWNDNSCYKENQFICEKKIM